MIISNCVINLSGDKDRCSPRPSACSSRAAASRCPTWWCAASCRPRCAAVDGAVGRLRRRRALEDDYRAKLAEAGFTGIELEVTREYSFDDARSFLAAEGLDAQQLARDVVGRVVSAFVRATKPAEADACCGPTCCG